MVSDEFAALTTIVVSRHAPKNRVAALAKRVNVAGRAGQINRAIHNPQSTIDLRWLLKKLGAENVTSLLVEGGGEVNASFLLGGLAQRVGVFLRAENSGRARCAQRRRGRRRKKSDGEVIQLARSRMAQAGR